MKELNLRHKADIIVICQEASESLDTREIVDYFKDFEDLKLNEAIIDSNNQRHKFVVADADNKSLKKELQELKSQYSEHIETQLKEYKSRLKIMAEWIDYLSESYVFTVVDEKRCDELITPTKEIENHPKK